MVIIYPPPPLASPSLSCRRHLKPLYQRAYSPNCMVIIHTLPITFFAEQDIMYYFLISHKIYTLFSSFFLLATNKGDTSLRHWVLVPVSCLFCTTRQNSTIFKRSLHMQGFSGGGGLVIGEPRQGKGNFTPLCKGIHKVEYTIEIKKDYKN